MTIRTKTPAPGERPNFRGRLRVAGGPALETVARDRFRSPRGSLQLMSQEEFELHFVSNDEIELRVPDLAMGCFPRDGDPRYGTGSMHTDATQGAEMKHVRSYVAREGACRGER